MFRIQLSSLDQIYEGKHDVYIACPKTYYSKNAYKDLETILMKRNIECTKRTSTSITLHNGCTITFLNDHPDNFKGLREYYYDTLDHLEILIKEELKCLEQL